MSCPSNLEKEQREISLKLQLGTGQPSQLARFGTRILFAEVTSREQQRLNLLSVQGLHPRSKQIRHLAHRPSSQGQEKTGSKSLALKIASTNQETTPVGYNILRGLPVVP